LKKFSISPDSAFNGLDCLEKVEASNQGNNPYHIIFLDCNMPILDGFETALELNKKMKDGQIKPVYIVGCTAYNSENEMQQCYDHGMQEVLNKPVC